MGAAIGEVLSPAVAVAISPLPISALILMLFSERAGINSLVFLVGWIAGLTAIGAVVLAFGSASTSAGGGASTGSGVVRLAIGVLFVGMAARSWRRRPAAGDEPQMPSWMETIDRFSAVKSFGVAIVLTVANPKNLGLTIAAASAIAAAELGTGEEIGAFAVFLAIACSTVAGPVIYFALARDRATITLDRLKAWLIANNNVVMAVLLIVIGAKLIGDGVSILSD